MIAITMGDPNGIGPEITYKYCIKHPSEDILIIGNKEVLDSFGPQLSNKIIDPFGKLTEYNMARATAQNGKASYSYVQKAIEMAKNSEIKAIVTAPINKDALHQGGIKKDGHTEILAEATGIKNFGMMFYSKELSIMLTTIHKALKDVPPLITKQKFSQIIDLAVQGMKDLGIAAPRVGVCGLNPHAGENGIFGNEEQLVIKPVIKEYQQKGITVSGPYPADTIFTAQRRNRFDIIIAHYHDQGLIPLKMLAFDSAVNITVGLPIIRTSVDHGTAYDIVGKNVASIESLSEAVAVARILMRSRFND